MLLSTKNPNIELLSQQLNTINDELRTSIDIEMQRLREEEIELQNALKYKTRQDLIKTMEKEIQMDDLNDSQTFYLTNSYGNLKPNSSTLLKTTTNNNYTTTTTTNNSNIINNSFDYKSEFLNSQSHLEDNLRASHLVLDKLKNEYASSTMRNTSTAEANIQEFLKQSANNSSFKNNYINYDKDKLVRPNVVYSQSYKNYKTIEPTPIKTTRIYMKTPTQDLNKQQTLKYSENIENQFRSKSVNDMNRSVSFDNKQIDFTNNPYSRSVTNERDYAKAIRDNYFYSDKERINGINKSKFRQSSYYKKHDPEYVTLPVSKTLIHNKPWSYGKVECIYYPYRDQKLNRK